MIVSIPSRWSRRASNSPEGPEPMMPTWVLMVFPAITVPKVFEHQIIMF
jgi:hypothetical protein